MCWGIYTSCVDHEKRGYKLAMSIYHVWITKQKVLNLGSLIIMCRRNTKEKVFNLWSLYSLC